MRIGVDLSLLADCLTVSLQFLLEPSFIQFRTKSCKRRRSSASARELLARKHVDHRQRFRTATRTDRTSRWSRATTFRRDAGARGQGQRCTIRSAQMAWVWNGAGPGVAGGDVRHAAVSWKRGGSWVHIFSHYAFPTSPPRKRARLRALLNWWPDRCSLRFHRTFSSGR
jgi:hypothetical protein